MKKVLFNIILLTLMQSAFGQTATFYDFNTSGQLSNLFNSVVQSGSVSQLTTGGIGNSGGISLGGGGANAIFSTKEGYSLGPAGSSDNFESFVQSVGNSGYSGVGFTASVPVSASSDGYYRPTDAFGISAHGGGFIFHNGATNYSGNWSGSGNDAAITTIKASSVWDLLNEGSASDWYKLIFKMTRATLTTFDLRVEVWNSDASGTMLDASAAAIFEVRGVTNATLANAPILHSYFNFSGYRVTNFDNFAINLTGGGSVIQAGAPVVLTNSGSESSGTITANGEVTSENGGTVTERGFVYATTVDPTLANTKVVSGSGLGTFSGSITGLPAGTTYYLRAYATNSTGTTSYGSDLSFTTGGICGGDIIGSGYGTNPSTGYKIDANWQIVTLPQGFTASETLPYNAYVVEPTKLADIFIARTGYTVSGDTYYWIAPKFDATQLLAGSYNWIVQQTFTVAQSGFYDLNFSGAGDNAISFYINGVIDLTDPVKPTITGGTQIGAKHNSFTSIANFSGVTYLNAGVNTASMVMEDSGGLTTALISGSSFTCNNTYVNIIPVISAVGDAIIVEGAAPSPIAFTISDLETPLNNLTLTATSSNQALIPNGNIVFAGATGSRTITTTPVLGEAGTATITITLDDNAGGVVTETFVVTISELALNKYGQYVSDPTQVIDMYGGVGRGFGIKKSGKTINKPLPPKVGDTYQGGIIFYIFTSGAGYVAGETHGLIASTADQAKAYWANRLTAAAAYTGGGYTDWRLPNTTELGYLYAKRGISGLSGTFDTSPASVYWPSNNLRSASDDDATGFSFNGGNINSASKSYTNSIRPIRSF